MTGDRVHVALAITTGLDPQTLLDGLRVLFAFSPAQGRLESAVAAAVPDGSTVVIVQGEDDRKDGVYTSPEIDTDISDNPYLQVWLHPNDDYEYRLPAATWKADQPDPAEAPAAHRPLETACPQECQRAKLAERERDSALERFLTQAGTITMLTDALGRVRDLIESYPPGSGFATSGAQDIFRRAAALEPAPDEQDDTECGDLCARLTDRIRPLLPDGANAPAIAHAVMPLVLTERDRGESTANLLRERLRYWTHRWDQAEKRVIQAEANGLRWARANLRNRSYGVHADQANRYHAAWWSARIGRARAREAAQAWRDNCHVIVGEREHQRGRAERAETERNQLVYERRLLGAARMTLDLVAAGGPERWDEARKAAEDVAQRIVDEIGHPVTDEPALGPTYREQLAQAQAIRDKVRALARQAKPSLAAPPADCTNSCYDDACDCSGKWRPQSWDLDPATVLAALEDGTATIRACPRCDAPAHLPGDSDLCPPCEKALDREVIDEWRGRALRAERKLAHLASSQAVADELLKHLETARNLMATFDGQVIALTLLHPHLGEPFRRTHTRLAAVLDLPPREETPTP